MSEESEEEKEEEQEEKKVEPMFRTTHPARDAGVRCLFHRR